MGVVQNEGCGLLLGKSPGLVNFWDKRRDEQRSIFVGRGDSIGAHEQSSVGTLGFAHLICM